jgi:hypothetical protein
MTTTPQVDKPEKRGNGWFIRSGQVEYFVGRVEDRWRCTCPSFRWRKTGECKHINAVRGMRREVTMG